MKRRYLIQSGAMLLLLFGALQSNARLLDSADSTQTTYQGEKSFWATLRKRAEQRANEAKNFIASKWSEMTKQTSPGGSSDDTMIANQKSASRGIASVQDSNPLPSATDQHLSGLHTDQTAAASRPSKTEEQVKLAEIIEKSAQEVKNKEVIQVAQEGREGTSNLPKKKSGVPIFELEKKESKKGADGKKVSVKIAVKDIPKLDIGLERSISKSDLVLQDDLVGIKTPVKPKELPSPALHSEKIVLNLKKMKIPVVGSAIKPKHEGVEIGQLVSMKKIEAVPLDMVALKPIGQLKEYVEFSAQDLDMVAAVILFEKGDLCHLVTGLLTDLATNREHSEEANFYMGVCAHQMGFHSEAVSRLHKVVKSESSEFATEAIGNIVEDLPREYDQLVSSAIKNLKNKSLIAEKDQSAVNFILARAAHANGEYSAALDYSAKVSEKNKLHPKARFMYGIALYSEGKRKEAEDVLLQLRAKLTQSLSGDKHLEGLIALNLARMRFTQGRYQAAHEEYLKIPKDQAIWVQALIEQGWTQLNIDDPEGAIGNMYSLHSPYFKSVFMPESWVVRTIGYIDICQYGDAYRTLTRFEQSHRSFQEAIENYAATKKAPLDYYTTVKNYIRGKSDQPVDGLPSQVIREIARQKEFLSTQGALNVLEDEIAQYQFVYGFVKRDQSGVQNKLLKTKARLAKVQADIASIKTKPELFRNLGDWQNQKRLEEQLVRSYQYQAQIYERARLGYLRMKAMALSRIEKQKGDLRLEAGRELMAHLKDLNKRLNQILEGNEFLRYEIFAGSGENIRYQVSGGNTSEARRVPANVKPQKILNWEFDGEYWEDEIGSYRSTLKNNCPKHLRSKNSGAAEGANSL